ncbi:hypothetical protein [Ktedonobacter racemifer]|uniref:hypothetical protein n=1 Tax=Ktedonobacter racemifer TaxID=363277 RepID=UPI001B7FCAC7|nr:hypothetical protein [Ktedonobacter racemifer]
MASFQSEQQADRDQLAWVQFGLAMLGDLLHLVVDKAEHIVWLTHIVSGVGYQHRGRT